MLFMTKVKKIVVSQKKHELIKYSAALAITGTIPGSSFEKLCLELGLASGKSRRWFRKLCSF